MMIPIFIHFLICLHFSLPIHAIRSRAYILFPHKNGTTNSRLMRRESAEAREGIESSSPVAADFVQMTTTTTIGAGGGASSDPCLLKCKDGYMLNTQSNGNHPMSSWRMDSAIGSPLNALIDTMSTPENSLDRVAMECSHHNDFLVCLKRCEPSAARQILADGQEAMKTVCHGFKGDKEFLHYVLPCLAKNGQRIGKKCQLHWSLMENDIYEAIQRRLIAGQNEGIEIGKAEGEEEEEEDGFRRLCRAMSSYADCHLKTVAQLCHRRTVPFFVRLNNKSAAALLKMLLDWFGRAQIEGDWLECEHWDPNKLLENERNGGLGRPPIANIPLFLIVIFIAIYGQ